MEMLKIMDINRDTIISEILSNFPEAMPKFQELWYALPRLRTCNSRKPRTSLCCTRR